MNKIRTNITAVAIAIPLITGSANAVSAGPVGDCVKGAVKGSLTGWAIAFILAPFTGGASLALGPAVEVVAAGAAAGCVLNAGGTALAATVDEDYRRKYVEPEPYLGN